MINLDLRLTPNEKEFYETIMTEGEPFFIDSISKLTIDELMLVEHAIRKFRVCQLELPHFLEPLTDDEIAVIKTAHILLERQTIMETYSYLDDANKNHFRLLVFKSFLQYLP